MKAIVDLTQEQKEALKFPLENVNPNDSHSKVTVKDLRVIDKICTVIETSEEVVNLEDADFTYLKNKFDSFGAWNTTPEARKVIMAVSDKLQEAEHGS